MILRTTAPALLVKKSVGTTRHIEVYAPSDVRNEIQGRSGKPVKKILSFLFDERQIGLCCATVET